MASGSKKSSRQTEATKALLIDIKDSIMANIWQLPDLAAKLINTDKKKNEKRPKLKTTSLKRYPAQREKLLHI